MEVSARSIRWPRSAFGPELVWVVFEYSTNRGEWIHLGMGRSTTNGWVFDGGTFPDSATVRARGIDRKSTRLNSSHIPLSRMPSSA